MALETRSESLEERLRSHARSFDGLLSLIPAKYYYGEDTSDQWQRKKQTKEEARDAKRAKLDPDNFRSAKDVLDEQAANQRKRKREEKGNISDEDIVSSEPPKSVAAKKGKETRRQKREGKGDSSVLKQHGQSGDTKRQEPDMDETAIKHEKAQQKRLKRQQKKAKLKDNAVKAEVRKARKSQQTALEASTSVRDASESEKKDEGEMQSGKPEVDVVELGNEFNEFQDHHTSTASPSPTIRWNDASNDHSGSSSISSIVPTIIPDKSSVESAQKEINNEPQQPKVDPEILKSRLQQRIDDLRAARKADGPNGAPAKNRQELMEVRRQKEEQRRAHKEELRQKAKEAEKRGSPLVSPGSTLTPSSESNNFSFGRVSFPDGQRASANLDSILDNKTKVKGPSDPRTALLAAQNKLSRLSGLDESKRNDIAEKDLWLNAKKQAHGQRRRDDTSLLKKTLKRKEKQKKKSEREWNERIEGVQKGQVMRQKKREANLQKRKDAKGGPVGGGKKGKPKPKARPGFEGSFKTKAPSSVAGNEGPRRR